MRLAPVVIPTVIMAIAVITVTPTPAALAASAVTRRKKREGHKYDSGAPAALARSRVWLPSRLHINLTGYSIA